MTFTIIFSDNFKKKIVILKKKDKTTYEALQKKILQTHEKDEDFVALALLKQCKIWSYETRLLDLGFGILTKQISNELLL
jgi:mRNA-degrading endonuclease RelE of RelBE toxin-antitoxin system